MKQLKKLFVFLLVVCTLIGSVNTSVYAAENTNVYPFDIVGQVEIAVDGKTTEIPIIFVTEDEMNQLIETGGIATIDNWVTDYVALSVTRDPSDSNKAKIVLMNVGFMFDIVDSVTGNIKFLNSKGQGIVNHQVSESRLIYMVPHTDTVTAVGFTKIEYSLTVTDGGSGTLNQGSREIP